MRNIELKAKLPDFDRAVNACVALGTAPQGDIHQVDTYFKVPSGRLKLREANPGITELVFYHRPDTAGAKGCDYTLEPTKATLKPILASALGVMTVVEKVRTLYLWENVRIHLDRVEGLGTFIEFEAVQAADQADEEGFRKLNYLVDKFTIGIEDVLARSYLEMVLDGAQAVSSIHAR